MNMRNEISNASDAQQYLDAVLSGYIDPEDPVKGAEIRRDLDQVYRLIGKRVTITKTQCGPTKIKMLSTTRRR